MTKTTITKEIHRKAITIKTMINLIDSIMKGMESNNTTTINNTIKQIIPTKINNTMTTNNNKTSTRTLIINTITIKTNINSSMITKIINNINRIKTMQMEANIELK